MDNADKVAASARDALGFVVAEGQSCPTDGFTGEVVVVGAGGVEGDEQFAGGFGAGAELDGVAAVQDFTGDGVEGLASLVAEKGRAFLDRRVDGRHVQDVGILEVAAVLGDCRIDGCRCEFLAVRGDTFRQRGQRFAERGELAELDDLAAVLRQRALLAELVVDQLGFGVFQKGFVIVGLHFDGHAAVAGDVGVGGVEVEQVFEQFHTFLLLRIEFFRLA